MQSSQVVVSGPRRILLGLTIWFVAELCAFALVVSFLGVTGALLLGLVTSLIGFSLLRRLGQDVALSFRQALAAGHHTFNPESMVDGTIAGIGGVLLILPGFLSDLVGLALSTPLVRLWLADLMKWRSASCGTRARAPRQRHQVIDLSDQEWHRIDDQAPDPRS
jgi:UPF0716 protein FxsA